jgi:hypothetical protein
MRRSAIRKIPATRSILFLAGAACVAVVGFRSLGDAQTGGKSCGSVASPAPLVGIAPVVAGRQITVMAFKRSNTGDQYLASLAASSNIPTPQPGQNLSSALATINNQMQAQQQLAKNLPSLFASAYGIQPNSSGGFTCGGLSPGKYTLVAVSRPTAPPESTSSPTPVPLNSMGASAIAALQNSGQQFYYSWAEIGIKNMLPLPQPSPKNGATPGPPQYPTVKAAPFNPIAQYPQHYFSP